MELPKIVGTLKNAYFLLTKRFHPKESHFKPKLSYIELEKTQRDFLEKFSGFNQFISHTKLAINKIREKFGNDLRYCSYKALKLRSSDYKYRCSNIKLNPCGHSVMKLINASKLFHAVT